MKAEITLTIDDFNIGDKFIIKNSIYLKKWFTVFQKSSTQIYCKNRGDEITVYAFQNENLGYYSENLEFKYKN